MTSYERDDFDRVSSESFRRRRAAEGFLGDKVCTDPVNKSREWSGDGCGGCVNPTNVSYAPVLKGTKALRAWKIA